MSKISSRDAEKYDGLRQLIREYASGTGAAAVGTGLSIVAALVDPNLAMPAAFLTKPIELYLTKLGQDMVERVLSPREKMRTGRVLVTVIDDIETRRASGEHPREDGFFDEKETSRSDAVEVAEAVLLKVQREPEEKKIQYMGHLLSSIAFDSQISVHMAHQLTKAAEQLTYRQLCILKLCAVKDKFGLRSNNYRECYEIENDLYEVLHECADLHNKEYIHSGLDTITFERNVLSRLRSIIPSNMAFQTIGDYLYNLMKLSQIPDEDIAPIAEQLK